MPKKLRFSMIIPAAWVLTSLLAVTAMLSGCGEEKRVPRHIPTLELPTYDGPNFRLSAQDTSVTLLVFWATWCRPCIMEIPALVELHKGLSEHGFRVVSVNVDDPGGKKIEILAKNFGINYPVLLGSDDHLKTFGNIQGLPTSFVVGRDGKIKDKIQGLVSPTELEKRVRAVLFP
jgi:thiol-disulfide isomerase/thioredoxin